MDINEFNYYFTIRDVRETGMHISVICKGLGYNEIDKNKVLSVYDINENDVDGQYYTKHISRSVELKTARERSKMEEMCKLLQDKWDSYKSEYLKSLGKGLDINFTTDAKYNTYCQLHLLPINEINVANNIIYLDCNKSVDEAFKTFIIMVTKAVLLDRWNDMNLGEFSYEFEAQNKTWMFVEIAVDAIFANTDLKNLCERPSYKYFYSLIIDNTNFMEQFRILYNMVPLEDFFNSVYMFVHKNYKTILKFKNYLY